MNENLHESTQEIPSTTECSYTEYCAFRQRIIENDPALTTGEFTSKMWRLLLPPRKPRRDGQTILNDIRKLALALPTPSTVWSICGWMIGENELGKIFDTWYKKCNTDAPWDAANINTTVRILEEKLWKFANYRKWELWNRDEDRGKPFYN